MMSLMVAGLVILLVLFCLVFVPAWLFSSCSERAAREGEDGEGCRRWASIWKNLCVACIVLPGPVLVGLCIVMALAYGS